MHFSMLGWNFVEVYFLQLDGFPVSHLHLFLDKLIFLMKRHVPMEDWQWKTSLASWWWHLFTVITCCQSKEIVTDTHYGFFQFSLMKLWLTHDYSRRYLPNVSHSGTLSLEVDLLPYSHTWIYYQNTLCYIVMEWMIK